MPICSFFLQNRCRFGESCRFEHPRGGGGGAQRNLFGNGGGGGGGGQRVTFRDSFGSAGNQTGNNSGGNSNQFKWTSNQQTQGDQIDPQCTAMDLVNGLPKEMDAWEKTKMWPFSCLSVYKELPCLPEFHDISVEEVRFEAYEAQKSGSMQAFNQKLQGLAQEYQTKRNQLRQMSMEVKQKLASFIGDTRRKKGTPTSPMTGSTSSVFGSAPATGQQSVFGNTNASATGSNLFGQSAGSGAGGLFGKTAASSTPFGSSSSMFGNNTASTSSLFGTTPQKPTNSGSLFGSQTQTPLGGNSLFGGGGQSTAATPNQTGTGLFGQQQQQQIQGQGLFGGSSSGLFGKPATAGSGQQNTTNSIFGNFGNNNVSAPTPGSTGLFGKPAASSMTTGAGGIFGQPPTQNPPSGLFGGGQNSNPSASPFTSGASGGSLFGTNNQAASSSTATGTGLFGKPAMIGSVFGGTQAGQQSTNPSMGGGLLPTPATTGGTGLFGKGIQSPLTSNIQQTGSGLFGNAGNSGLQNASLQGNVFGTGAAAVSTSMAGLGSDSVSKKHFSSMDELSPQDIEAFKADSFVLGKIPIKPPPRELVIQ